MGDPFGHSPVSACRQIDRPIDLHRAQAVAARPTLRAGLSPSMSLRSRIARSVRRCSIARCYGNSQRAGCDHPIRRSLPQMPA
jgi:hypothetical protein